MGNNIIAIIPARGGSQRIPNKNINNFLGKPIIFYAIKAALNSKIFDEVMVSTDNQKIADISKKYGAEIPFLRSNKNSQNNIPLKNVIIEVLQKYENNGKKFDYVCCLLPTAPLITPERISQGLNLLKKGKSDAVVSVVKFSHPIQRAFKIENDYLKMISPENANATSQSLLTTFHDAGQFYWLKVKNFLKSKEIFMDKTVPFKIPEEEAQDIDSFSDWKMAELKYLNMNNV